MCRICWSSDHTPTTAPKVIQWTSNHLVRSTCSAPAPAPGPAAHLPLNIISSSEPCTLHSVERRVDMWLPPTLRWTMSSPAAPLLLHTCRWYGRGQLAGGGAYPWPGSAWPCVWQRMCAVGRVCGSSSSSSRPLACYWQQACCRPKRHRLWICNSSPAGGPHLLLLSFEGLLRALELLLPLLQLLLLGYSGLAELTGQGLYVGGIGSAAAAAAAVLGGACACAVGGGPALLLRLAAAGVAVGAAASLTAD